MATLTLRLTTIMPDAVVDPGRRAPRVAADRDPDRRPGAPECLLQVERHAEHRGGLPDTLELHREALRGHARNHMVSAMGALRVERDGHVLRVTLARPERRNAFDAALIAELTEAFADVGDARAVVLSGEGPSFCAGADVEWQRSSIDLSYDENVEDAMRLYRMLEAIDACPAPVVCVVQGYALGGGSGLVACADIAVARPDAVFGFTEVRLGIIPAVISPFVLPKIGSAARRYFLTGERFGADVALRIGLVHEVTEDADEACRASWRRCSQEDRTPYARRSDSSGSDPLGSRRRRSPRSAARATRARRGYGRSSTRAAHPGARRSRLLLPGEHDRRGRALDGTVEHGFDVVPVRIEDERGVVAGVVRPLSGCTVVPTARCERSLVKAAYGLAIGSLEREVETGRGRTVARDEQLVGGEPAVALARELEAERLPAHRRRSACSLR